MDGSSDWDQPALLQAALVASLPIAFVLSFAIGANDVANSFGTSYGSGVLSLRQCCLLATVFETLGAVLLGHNVSETVRKGVFELQLYAGDPAAPTVLALGYLCALVGSALWNLAATLLKLPVSGTHSILGAVLGFHVAYVGGPSGLRLWSLATVVASWFVSPLLAGLASMACWKAAVEPLLARATAQGSTDSLRRTLPLFYALCLGTNSFSVLFRGPAFLAFFSPSSPEGGAWAELGVAALASCLIAALAAGAAARWWLPPKDDDLEQESPAEAAELNTTTGGGGGHQVRPERCFVGLQVLTACLGSLAHGANDVSNAVGPLVAVFLLWRDAPSVAQQGPAPLHLFLFGGAGISLGVWALGQRVIRTIGRDLSRERLTPSVGFTVELASALTVLGASKLGLPISTTHCKVGSVVSLAWLRGGSGHQQDEDKAAGGDGGEEEGTGSGGGGGVNWPLFAEIAGAWLLTVPVSALASGLCFLLLSSLFPAFLSSSSPAYP